MTGEIKVSVTEWTLLAAAAATAVLLMTMVLLVSARGRRHLLAQLASRDERIARLERDLRALCAAGAKVGDRVVGVEQDMRRVTQWQSQLELRNPQTESLRHAINLVERGASAEDLVSACGLSRGEADLMERFRSRAA